MNPQQTIDTRVKSISDLFTNAPAFVVPEYQRSYQWNSEHILSLIRDIHTSICILGVSQSVTNEIRFMGSIITIVQNAAFMHHGQEQPNTVHQIVDGQQRLSTFVLLAVVLQHHLQQCIHEIQIETYSDEIKNQLANIALKYSVQLRDIYSFSRYIPSGVLHHPSIIRAEIDQWRSEETAYNSLVAKSLYRFIHDGSIFDQRRKKNNLVQINLNTIDYLMNQIIRGDFPKIDDDDQEEPQKYNLYDVVHKLNTGLWFGTYDNIQMLVMHELSNDKSALIKFVRLLVFTNFFLHRCYLNHISTSDERWAFDMFIGLNTAGIPLSAVETFRAYLLQRARQIQTHSTVTDEIQKVFIDRRNGIEVYFDREKNINDRAKRIKEYVTTFALYVNGQKVGYNIHEQRNYLKQTLDGFVNGIHDHALQQQKQLEFLQYMRQMTQYLMQHDLLVSAEIPMFDELMNASEQYRDLAMLSIGFLYDANHTIVHALFARFYERVTRRYPNAAQEFVQVCLTVTAFFVLWRPIRGTNGLPDIYRDAMRNVFSQICSDDFSVNDVKSLLRSKLNANVNDLSSMDLTNRDSWIARASDIIRAKKFKDLSRFILLITAHETTKDEMPGMLGLMKKANPGFQQCATLNHWKSKDLKTIEHIAPQKPSESDAWDSGLYGTNTLFDSLGNLVLMPTEINSSVGNNNWRTKWTYYQYLALVDPNKRKQFVVDMGSTNNIVLQNSTLNVLKNATFAGHMAPIVAVGIDGEWTADLVQRRTRRMLEIFHDRMMQWLS
jgi:hypothetical protein